MAWRLLPGLQLYREGLEAPRHTVTRCWRATLGSAKAKLNYYRPVVRLSLYISRNLCSVLYVGQNTRVEPLCWTSLVCVKKNITAFASSTCTLSMSTSRRPCKDYQKWLSVESSRYQCPSLAPSASNLAKFVSKQPHLDLATSCWLLLTKHIEICLCNFTVIWQQKNW